MKLRSHAGHDLRQPLGRNFFVRACVAAFVASTLSGIPSFAQETDLQDAELRKSVLANLPKDAARRQFGAVTLAAPGKAEVIGEYWKGCYAGGQQLPPFGDHWQVMRLYRNRNWGTPILIDFLEKFSAKAAAATGWPGILIGDMSQPRGGPMLTGHASHQLGIEADIWLRPMPDRRLTPEEIGRMMSTDLLRADREDVDPSRYTRQHFEILRAAAEEPGVARVFVNAAIKKALCRDAGSDRRWLNKVRPVPGHTYHFHIRLACPKDQKECLEQIAPPPGDGCGKELDYWFTDAVLNAKPGKSSKAMSMAAMPKACRALVAAPEIRDRH